MGQNDEMRFGATVWVEPWIRVGDRHGTYDPRSDYVERFWLPILGPATTMLVRYLARVFDHSPTGGTLNVTGMARALGLGEQSGRNAPLLRTVARSVDFDIANWLGHGRLAVRRLLPALSPRQLAQLPSHLAVDHQRVVAEEHAAPDDTISRGRRLALSLLGLGEDVSEAERQLRRWRFPPALAAQCAAWANAAQLERAQVDAASPRLPIATAHATVGTSRRRDTPVDLGPGTSDAQTQ